VANAVILHLQAGVGVDNFNYCGKAVTLQWASVWEVDIERKISAKCDYWDAQERNRADKEPGPVPRA
jgi:hypothetical protein